MIDLASPITVVALAAGLALAVIGVALVLVRRARAQARKAERRLGALFAEIDAALGERIDRSSGGSWRDQVGQGLRRLTAEASARMTGDTAKAEPDWVRTAEHALAAAAGAVRAFQPGSEMAQVAEWLRLVERIQATLSSLSALRDGADIENALVSGVLNDLLTTEPLIAAYFGRDPAMVPVTEGYRIAASALRLALFGHGYAVDTPAPLSILSSADVRQEAVDGRELRRLAGPKALANRMAARLLPGESLVVYPMVPGWSTRESRQAPTVAVWNRASWLN
ncbi:hypothetical protein ACQVP2_18140 [Methylobacterium aquaticum]|uniref:hypothetical protein n=1 Tax=Methylobacterium aquaticum TaxID=270351 RepID=UPI003D17E6A8